MELMAKHGFKHSELGLIPEDWSTAELEEAANIVGGGTPSTSIQKFWNGHINWFTPTEIGTSKFACESIRKITDSGLKNSSAQILPKGSILLTTRASIGDLAILENEACTNQGFQSLVPKEGYNNEFLYYSILTKKRDLITNSSGSTFLEISPKKVKRLLLAFPPTTTEQKIIALALSDVDSLISSLEQLIVKKRSIKQGAMQQLLTPPDKGGKRLAGFSGKWKEINLGKSATLKARIGWQGLTTAEYLTSGNFRLVTGTDFKGGFIDWNNCVHVEKERYDQDKNIQLKMDDVLVTKDGTIGKIALINELPMPTTLNSGVFVIRSINNSFDQKFFYYILMSQHFNEFLNKLTAGSTISHLYQKDFVHFNFYAPDTITEQKAIAQILSDMDEEIEALEAKKIKYQGIKQGMMQELLTGKTRLV